MSLTLRRCHCPDQARFHPKCFLLFFTKLSPKCACTVDHELLSRHFSHELMVAVAKVALGPRVAVTCSKS